MITLIIECKVEDTPDEDYSIEVQRECPKCEYCNRDMKYDCYISDLHEEIWHCPKCKEIEQVYPGDYGSDFIAMNEQEYRDYRANERQKELLIERYGTEHPRSISDYWITL
jgi:hypothetical protein